MKKVLIISSDQQIADRIAEMVMEIKVVNIHHSDHTRTWQAFQDRDYDRVIICQFNVRKGIVDATASSSWKFVRMHRCKNCWIVRVGTHYEPRPGKKIPKDWLKWPFKREALAELLELHKLEE